MINWKAIELKGYAHYAEKGYRILVSLVDNYGYDFVAEKDGEFVRVNVKVASLKAKDEKGSWSITLAGGSGKARDIYATECDVYLAYLPGPDKFIEVNGDFFLGSKSKCKRIPRELYLS